jgi:DNA-binding SARP family transcriptional activator
LSDGHPLEYDPPSDQDATPFMARLTLTVLGGFEGRLDGGRPLRLAVRKAQALLAYLALPPGQAHPRDKLTALLWGGVSEARARASFRQALSTLRRAVGDGVLVQEGDRIALGAPAVDVDAVRLEQELRAGGHDRLESTVALYRGDLLAGLVLDEPPFEEWLLAERERLRELALEGLARLLASQRTAGDFEAGVGTALRLLTIDPLQESVHRTLMRLYARLGRRGDALRQYRECLSVLRREVDAEPETETRQLYQEILRARGSAAPPDSATFREATAAPAPSAGIGSSAADPPLLGRGTEMVQLTAALAAAWAGEGRVVLVRGEAGIGKSRLLAELAGEADRRGGRIVAGHAYEGEQSLPFGPWVDAIRQVLATLDPTELAGLPPAWRAELARLVPELAERPTPTHEGSGGDRRLLEAVVALVQRLAAPRPLLLVLEDLHWADEPSLRLLAFLGHRLSGHRVLVLLSVRDEELGDGPGAAGRVEELATGPGLVLTLGPLSRADVTTLVEALGRSGTDASAVAAMADRVWAASDGNPLLAVEATRAYAETSSVQLGPGSALPGRIRDLVAAQIRRASEPARAILAVAAVVTRDAAFSLLQGAARLEESTAAAAVEELVRRRLLREAGEGLVLTHDRLREVIYDSLLASRRQVLHRHVAETLEALYGHTAQPPWAALATHFREARDWVKAETALVRLGEQSAQRYADEEAARAFGAALDLVSQLPPDRQDRATVEVLLALAPSLYRLGRFQETVERLESHHPSVSRLDDPALAAPYAFWLGHAYGHVGGTEAVVTWARRAIEAARRGDDRPTLGKAQYLMCDRYFVADEFSRAIEHAREAVELLGGTDQGWWLGQAWYLLGGMYHFVGRFAESLEAESRAQAIGETIGDPRLQAYAAYVSGWTLAVRGDGARGIEACQRGLALALDAMASAGARYRLGVAYVEAGRAADGLPSLEMAVESFRAMNVRRTLVSAMVMLGEACRAMGQRARARALAEEATRLAGELGSAYRAAWADRLVGRLARVDGDLPAARHHLAEALRKFTDTEARFEAGRTHLDLGDALEASGNREGARWHFGQAREAFEACEAPAYVARAAARL